MRLQPLVLFITSVIINLNKAAANCYSICGNAVKNWLGCQTCRKHQGKHEDCAKDSLGRVIGTGKGLCAERHVKTERKHKVV